MRQAWVYKKDQTLSSPSIEWVEPIAKTKTGDTSFQ